jgi:septum formation protein
MTTSTSRPLLLASASPRRRQIIALLGLPYTVGVTPTDEEALERSYHGPAEGLASWLAEQKARAALAIPEAAGSVVVTADTTVLLAGRSLGKPRDEAHARELLRALRDRQHRVITGVCVSAIVNGEAKLRCASCTTPVTMRAYSEEEIAAYVASRDPLDKAGAYGIQHSAFQPTSCIDGCYYNVVGLPVCVLVDLLALFDVHPAAQKRAHQGYPCPWSEKCLLHREVAL